MREKIERFLAGLTVVLLILFLALAWMLRIEDPFGEAQEHEMLIDQAPSETP